MRNGCSFLPIVYMRALYENQLNVIQLTLDAYCAIIVIIEKMLYQL